ncbi:MAG: hypothetical protein EVB11_05625 [Winogradskyella sp.]|nr:MAG: hypothetical protein EVB11_05625 [Winogradskyella sp.]
MKKTILILLIFCVSVSYTQERSIEIDYVVDYAVPNKRTQSMDTVSIGFNKDGKFLWTNASVLAKKLADTKFMSKASNSENSEINLLYNTINNKILFSIIFGDNEIYANMDMASIIPINSENSFDEDISFMITPLNQKESMFEREVSVFELYPQEESNEGLRIILDENLYCNNNVFTSGFISLMLKMTSSTGDIKFDIPNGLFLKAYDLNDNLLIEAINIDTDKKTIKINYNFQIEE